MGKIRAHREKLREMVGAVKVIYTAKKKKSHPKNPAAASIRNRRYRLGLMGFMLVC